MEETGDNCSDGDDSSSMQQRILIQSTFNQIKSNVLKSLYGGGVIGDKSPKGSLDEPIRDLVHLINQHPNYVTLSSCSGRIALFDPSPMAATCCEYLSKAAILQRMHSRDTAEQHQNYQEVPLARKGKGGGTWLLSSHVPIHFLELEKALFSSNNEHNSDHPKDDEGMTLIFKHEPFLMHIACSNVKAAQRLLQVALSKGYRESGIIFTNNKRITVAIRTQGLALQVPLSRNGNLRPSSNFLHGLVHEANHKLAQNLQKLSMLQRALEEAFMNTDHSYKEPVVSYNFQQQAQTSSVQPQLLGQSTNEYQDREGKETGTKNYNNNVPSAAPKSNWVVTFEKQLPDLSLWDHAAVVVHCNSSNCKRDKSINNNQEDTHILVIGGYGVGPRLNTSSSDTDRRMSSSSSSSRRMDAVFRLVRRGCNRQWDPYWEQLYPSPSKHGIVTKDSQQIHASSSDENSSTSLFSPRQGHAACCVNISSPTVNESTSSIFIFGGRTSPTNALNDLFILHYRPNGANKTEQSLPCISFQLLNSVTKGSTPLARWGHTFISLADYTHFLTHNNSCNSSENHLALLVGGRDGTNTFSDINVLSSSTICNISCGEKNDRANYHLHWSKVADLQIPRFHHSATMITMSGTDDIFSEDGKANTVLLAVFGGLSSATNLLDCFNGAEQKTNMELFTLKSEFDGVNENNKEALAIQKATVASDNVIKSFIGASACSWDNIIIMSGGVPCSDDFNAESAFTFLTVSPCGNCNRYSGGSTNTTTFTSADHKIFYCTHRQDDSHSFVINVGSMVNHCSLSLNKNRSTSRRKMQLLSNDGIDATSGIIEFVIIGGGTPMFSFGPSYGRLVVKQGRSTLFLFPFHSKHPYHFFLFSYFQLLSCITNRSR